MIDKQYWNQRYTQGGNSGNGSYGAEAIMKGSIINHWIDTYKIRTISEFGCGDANNLMYYKVPISYDGYDFSEKAIQICNEKTRRIPNGLKYTFTNKVSNFEMTSDLMLCLDVWYHQTDDKQFEEMCDVLFNQFKGKYIIIYSTDTSSQFLSDGTPLASHLKYREVVSKIAEYPEWEVLYWLSGYNTQEGKQFLFPAEKKFFLIGRKGLEIPKE